MYKIIFIVSLVIIISAIITNSYNSTKELENVNKDIQTSINYFNNNVVTNIECYNNYFSDRYVVINNECISIGRNKNELDNGYYDLCIKLKDKNIEIYVNKLFKEFSSKTMYDEAYVNTIIEYIMRIFDLKIDKELFSQLIITNYELVRDINRNNVHNVDKVVEINSINIVVSKWQNMLVLKMGDK